MTASVDRTHLKVNLPRSQARSAAEDGSSDRLATTSPWQRRDLVICGLLVVLGGTGLLGCWIAVSDQVIWREQTGWLVGSILCSGLVVLGGGLWALIGLRRVRQGFRDLRRDQRAALGLTRMRTSPAPALDPSSTDLVTAAAMTRVHRPECLLLRGKQVVTVAAADVDRYSRCGVCNS